MTTEPVAIELRGTVTIYTDDERTQTATVVYQRVAPGCGNIRGDGSYNRQRRAHVSTPNPNTTKQQQQRALMAHAVATYRELTPEQKAAYEPAAKRAGYTRYNAYVAEYLITHRPILTTWDNATTTWDDGTTTWEAATIPGYPSQEPPPPTPWDETTTDWDNSTTTWD
jgi:hypothetical protein